MNNYLKNGKNILKNSNKITKALTKIENENGKYTPIQNININYNIALIKLK